MAAEASRVTQSPAKVGPDPWLHVVGLPCVSRELAAVLAEPAFAGVTLQILPLPLAPTDAELRDALASASDDWPQECPVCLVADRRFGAIGAAQAARCIIPDTLLATVAGADRARQAQAAGDLLLLPAWIEARIEAVHRWQYDAGSLGAFVAEGVRRVVWLDTGVDDGAVAQLDALGALLDRPTERWAVGLDGLREALARAALTVRNEQAARLTTTLQEVQARLGAQLVALDAFARLAGCHDRAAVEAALSETIPALLGGATARLLPADAPPAEGGWPLQHQDRLLGHLQVEGGASSSGWERDSWLALMAPVVALALLRLEVEASVAATERYGELLLESSLDGLLVVNAAGQVQLASPSAAELLGYAHAAELVGQPLVRLEASPEHPIWIAAQRALQTGCAEGPVDRELCRRDGGRLAAICRLLPVDRTRCVVRFRIPGLSGGVADDLRGLRVFQLAADGVAILGPEGRVRMANAAFERLLGHALGQILGRSLSEVEPSLRETVRRAAAALESTDQWSEELSRLRDDGTLQVLRVQVIAVRSPDQRLLEQVVLATDRTRAHQERVALERTAYHDPLTGLLTQTRFQVEVQAALAEAPVAVVIYDIDRFNQVNESLGYPEGDRVLQRLAERLVETGTPGEANPFACARLTADSFAVAWQGLSMARAAWLAADLHARLKIPIPVERRQHYLSLTAGLTFGEPGARAEDLLREAETALNRQKRRTPGTLSRFAPAMLEAVNRRHWIDQALREALAHKQLDVWFQPVVQLTDGHPFACEALARWRHPEAGWISPAEFIPVAEETGLIRSLTAQVARRACAAAARWRATPGGARVRVSINLSATDLTAPELLPELHQARLAVGLPAEALVLELTESAALKHPAGRARLRALKAQGHLLAMDDFGDGYANLTELLDLPFDILKVDQGLVRGLSQETRTLAVLKVAVTLARSLELYCVAEGVETEAQAAVLRDLGVTLAQGFAYARPMPLDALLRWLPEVSRPPAPDRPHVPSED